jgi:benzoyl-CoA reductase/2-hydroxyglutaryl-CoA dehydratase subunit BcrC/BadD/HgdB
VAPEDDLVPRVLEELGASMVPLHCSGRMIPLPEEPASGAPGELAREYFGALRCARCRPDGETIAFLAGSVERYGCSGLILKALKFCDLWFSQRERLKEILGVPVLVLDTGYSPGEEERLSTRMEAFLEELS